MTITNTTIAGVLRTAAGEVRRRGLAHGTLAKRSDEDYDSDGSDLETCKVCALGALAAAYFGDPRRGFDVDDNPGYEAVVNAVSSEVAPTVAPSYPHVYKWNDGSPYAGIPGQDTETVATTFERLASKLERGEIRQRLSKLVQNASALVVDIDRALAENVQ